MANAFDFRKVSFSRLLLTFPLALCIYFAMFANEMWIKGVSLALAVVIETIRDSLLIVELTKPKK